MFEKTAVSFKATAPKRNGDPIRTITIELSEELPSLPGYLILSFHMDPGLSSEDARKLERVLNENVTHISLHD